MLYSSSTVVVVGMYLGSMHIIASVGMNRIAVCGPQKAKKRDGSQTRAAEKDNKNLPTKRGKKKERKIDDDLVS